MDLAEQIRIKFANLSEGNALILEGFDEKYQSWAIKFSNSYAVAIEISEDALINESFANVSYYTGKYTIEGELKSLLILSSTDESLRNEFAGICALFLEVGPNGSKREELVEDPVQWWLNWKNLIGNKNIEKPIHGVLGELVVLYYLKKNRTIKYRNYTY